MKDKRQLTNIRENIYKAGHTGNTTTTLKHVRDKLLSAKGNFKINLPKGPILHTNRAQKESRRMCSISLSSSAKDELDIYSFFFFSFESLIFWANTNKLQMEESSPEGYSI
jgi:hypothetical protein